MLSKLFVAALAIRWLYALVIFSGIGDPGLLGIDSIGYVANAQDLARSAASGLVHGVGWLGPSTLIMPLFTWLVAFNVLLFGTWGPLAYVLLQGAIDAGTCLLIYGIARAVHPRFAWPAAIAAVINPTQIVLTGLIYTDTPFVAFSALMLYGSLRWLREPEWCWALLTGMGLGGGALIRAVMVPWAPILLLFLLAVALVKRRLSRSGIAQLAGAGAVFAICISPVIWRNASQYGTPSITSQGGMHFALWVVPLVKEARDGTPWMTSYNDMQKRTNERYPTPTADPFEQSRRYTAVARERLAELGVGAAVKAWLTGAAINLASPAIILSPPVSQLPRTGFFGTPGATPIEKIINFMFRSDNSLYDWILLTGIAGLILVRCMQLVGFGAATKLRDWPAIGLFVLWIGYVLAINGPVASPKYRLPIEPPLMVFTGAGYQALRQRIKVGLLNATG